MQWIRSRVAFDLVFNWCTAFTGLFCPVTEDYVRTCFGAAGEGILRSDVKCQNSRLFSSQ